MEILVDTEVSFSFLLKIGVSNRLGQTVNCTAAR